MKRIALLVTMFVSAIIILAPGLALASTSTDAVCQGVGLASGTSGCSDSAGSPSVNSVIGEVIKILGLIVGVAAVLVIIISGLRFITANGDSAKVSSARDGILYALIGLVIAAMAEIIVKFVLNQIK